MDDRSRSMSIWHGFTSTVSYVSDTSGTPVERKQCGTIWPMRRVSYRTAAFAFIFTSLWFIIGLLVLWSPIPSAMGIHSQMLVAWLLLFFVILGASGATLIVASINAAFPRRRGATPRSPVAARAAAGTRATTERRGGTSRSQTRG